MTTASWIVWAGIGVSLAVGLILARWGQALARLAGIMAALLVGLLLLVALILQSWASAEAAHAAATAAAGQTVATTGVTILALSLLLVVLLAGGVIGYLVWRLRRLEQHLHKPASYQSTALPSVPLYPLEADLEEPALLEIPEGWGW